MRKVLNLYRNELTKTSRKVFYIVVIAVTIAAMILTGLLEKQSTSEEYWGYSDEYYNDEWYKNNVSDSKSYRDSEYLTLMNNFEKAEQSFKDDGIYYDDENKIVVIGDDVYPDESYLYSVSDYFSNYVWAEQSYNTAIVQRDYDLKGFYAGYIYDETLSESSSDGFFAEIAKNYVGCLTKKNILEIYAEIEKNYPICYNLSDDKFGFSWVQDDESLGYMDTYKSILDENDFDKYIDLKNKIVNDDTSLGETEKKIKIECNEILRTSFSADMDSDDWYSITNELSILASGKIVLATGYKNGSLQTESEIAEAKLQVEEITASLENNAAGFGGKQSQNDKSAQAIIIMIGIMFSKIILIVMASLLVADEIQSGSVKLLIIAPVKRNKIFFAKVMILVTFCLMMTVLMYLTLLLCNLLFGYGMSTIVFVTGNSVHVMNPYLYYLLYILASFVHPFMIASFALMLSSVLRNSGASIAVTMVMVFAVDTIVKTIFSDAAEDSYLIRNLVPFLPAFNAGIESKLFSSSITTTDYNIIDILTGELGMSDYKNGAWASLIYTVILTFIMLFVAEQSFEKRDIK